MIKKIVSVMILTLLLVSILTLAFNIQPVSSGLSLPIESPHPYEPITEITPWVWVRDTVTGAYGEAVVGTGDAIYVARKNSFYRYNPADNSWTTLAAPPNPDSGDAFKTGTALAWDFSDYIYALYGAATGEGRRWFYRYCISSDSWEALANTTYDQGEADAITWVGIDNCTYATVGGEQRPTYFIRYNASTNSWSNEQHPQAGMGDGASLVWTGGDSVYALRGEYYESSPLFDFWRYNLTDDVWTAIADIPATPWDGGVGGVGDGGSLLYAGFWLSNQADYIYALSGNQAHPDGIPDNRTYRYTISLDSWERLADLPFGVGYYVGCRLGYADGHIYAWQGAPSTWNGGGDDLARYKVGRTDIAVINVTLSKTVVGQGYSMSINVTVENQGDCTESFNVTVFYNETAITLPNGKNHTTTTLTSGNSTTITLTWNTTGWIKGNYTISAYITPVPGEIDLSDNNFTDGWVFVTIQGDVDGDRDVDIYDVVKITGIYHSKRGDPQFNPNSDLDDDGEIKIYDVVRCTSHYGQSWQP